VRSILILGSYPPPYGGVPRHLEELTPSLVRGGWDVHILATGHSGVQSGAGFTVYKESQAQKALRALGGIFRGDWGRLSRLLIEDGLTTRMQWLAWASLGRNIIRSHPVKVISVYNLLRLPVGVLLSEEFQVPLVISNFGEAYSHRAVLERRIDAVRRGTAGAAKRLSISQHCACSYQQLGLTSEVDVIAYGVDTALFSPSADGSPIRTRFGIAPDELMVLYVGRMIRDMGLDTVLAAVPEVLRTTPRVRVVLAGGKGNLSSEVAHLVATHPGRVNVASDVPTTDLPRLYAAADIVVAPTQGARACGSLASIEAMASGKAVIAARVGGIPEIVQDRVTGLLIAPNDPRALAAAIAGLANDGAGRRQMGMRGRERALSTYDVRVQNARLVRLFDDLATRSGSG